MIKSNEMVKLNAEKDLDENLEQWEKDVQTCRPDGTTNGNLLQKKMGEVLDVFKWVSDSITADDVREAIAHYDGNGDEPYCDLVYCGLDVLRKYIKVRGELDAFCV